MNIIHIYTGLKSHDYREEDGHTTHDHFGGALDLFWIFIIMIGIFVVGDLIL